MLDMVGVAQKGGAVLSHIKIAQHPEDLHSVEVGAGGADLLLGCDLVVSASPESLSRIRHGETRVIVNNHNTPIARFIHDPNIDFESSINQRTLAKAAGEKNSLFLEATQIATALFGDSIAANMFLLGAAYQSGVIPVSSEAIERAIELNGIAVEMNKSAFAWGRLATHNPTVVEAEANKRIVKNPATELSETLEQVVGRRVDYLTKYQNSSYAARYRSLVDTVKTAETTKTPGTNGFAEAVARYAFKLMAYKDEYEVARLHSDGTFLEKIRQTFEGDFKLIFHLAPPLLARRDPRTGQARKMTFGPWVMVVFRLLAKLKVLRGTPLDIFSYTAERRRERQLVEDYFETVEELIQRLDHDNHSLAIQIAEIPELIRGYGHIKEQHFQNADAKLEALLSAFRDPTQRPAAAE